MYADCSICCSSMLAVRLLQKRQCSLDFFKGNAALSCLMDFMNGRRYAKIALYAV